MTPRQEKILAVIVGLAGLAGFILLYLRISDWYDRPKCPKCGKRMRYVVVHESNDGQEWTHG